MISSIVLDRTWTYTILYIDRYCSYLKSKAIETIAPEIRNATYGMSLIVSDKSSFMKPPFLGKCEPNTSQDAV